MNSKNIDIVEIRSINDPDYPECRSAYAEYDNRYHDPELWRNRVLGFDNNKLIGVGAYLNDRWIGGFITYCAPMMGPDNKQVKGGKMESMITSKEARGKEYQFTSGRVERVSVAISRELINISMDAGLQIIFGVPNAPAYKAHKLAGHGLLNLPIITHNFLLSQNSDKKTNILQRLFHSILSKIQHCYRLLKMHGKNELHVKNVDNFSEDVNSINKKILKRMPGISISRDNTFLNWRYKSNQYIKIESRDTRGILKGILIGSKKTKENVANLIDFIGEPDYKQAYYSLINAYIIFAKEQGMNKVKFTSLGKGSFIQYQRHILTKTGFFPIPGGVANWIVDGGNGFKTGDLLNPRLWNVGGLFFDSL